MDQIDRRILKVLQTRAGVSNAELAQAVGSSSAACWRRVKALEETGTIGATVRLLDPASVGVNLEVICQVRMRSHDREARAAFEAFTVRHDHIMQCYSMSGEWDYLLRVVATSMADYERFLMRELLSHEAVATSASHFALSTVKNTTALPL